METLLQRSIKSLRLKDVQFIPETLWDELFDGWFTERMSRANLHKVLKENKLLDVLRREVKMVLKEDGLSVIDRDGKPLSSYQRAMLHTACKWLGVTSLTGEYQSGKHASVTIERKYTDPDDLALIMLDKEPFMMRTFRKQKMRSRRYECDSCGEFKDAMDIAESVYHRGRYCEDCLRNGECPTDPGYDSKWEALADFMF